MIQNTPTIMTERLILRKFTLEDVDALYAILSDHEVNTYLPFFPVKTKEEAQLFFQNNYEQTYQQPVGYKYAICLKTDNIPIGYIGVSTSSSSHDFGYALRKEFWHQKITSEAGKAVLQQVSQDGLPFVTATHDVNNKRSGDVMKRLGLKYQYSYQEQWQPKNILVTFKLYQLNFDGAQGVYQDYWNQSQVHYMMEEE